MYARPTFGHLLHCPTLKICLATTRHILAVNSSITYLHRVLPLLHIAHDIFSVMQTVILSAAHQGECKSQNTTPLPTDTVEAVKHSFEAISSGIDILSYIIDKLAFIHMGKNKKLF